MNQDAIFEKHIYKHILSIHCISLKLYFNDAEQGVFFCFLPIIHDP